MLQTKMDDRRAGCARDGQQLCEIGVLGHDSSTLFDSQARDGGVRRFRHAKFTDVDNIMAGLTKPLGSTTWKALIKHQLHLAAETSSDMNRSSNIEAAKRSACRRSSGSSSG